MATTNLGRVAIVHKGAYNALTAYSKLDCVVLNGSSYLCIQDGTGQNPATATTYWQLMAAQGSQDIVTAAEAARDSAQGYAEDAAASAAQLAAGVASPAGTYADLAALTAANPDHSKIYITLDDGKWCYWNGSAWASGGVYVGSGIQPGYNRLTKQNTDIAEHRNLLYLANITQDVSINSTGTETANAGWQTTEYFPVVAGETYCYSVNGVLVKIGATSCVAAFYTSGYQFISRVTAAGSPPLFATFVPPVNAAFCRVSAIPGFASNAVLEHGSTPSMFPTALNVECVENNVILPKMLHSDLLALDELILTKVQGYYHYTGTFVDTAGWFCAEVPCKEGDVFQYYGILYGSNGHPMALFFTGATFVSHNGVVSALPAVTYRKHEVVIPANIDSVVFNFYGAFGGVKKIGKQKQKIAGHRFSGHRATPHMAADYQHIIGYGQSLSVGADALYVADAAMPDNYILGAITTPGTTLNPLALAANGQHPVVSAVNSFSTLYRGYQNKGQTEFVVGSYGAGGTAIAQLMSAARQAAIKTEESFAYDIDDSGKYAVFLQALSDGKDMADAAGKTIECPAIIFLQGERDYWTDAELIAAGAGSPHAYACGANKDLYKTYMGRLKDDMQAAVMAEYGQTIAPLFFICQVSGGFIKYTDMTISMAQIEFAEENNDVILMQAHYPMPDYSNVHLSTNGYRWYGEYIAKAMFRALVLHENNEPMLPAGFLVDGDSIRIKVKNAVLPLVIDDWTVDAVADNGFHIVADGTPATITGVAVYGDEIIVTTSASLASATTLTLSYAGLEAAGHGNIRDSDRYEAMYTYWDDAADTGASGTLSIAHRPLDKDGASIVGDKYPMQNWLTSFFETIR